MPSISSLFLATALLGFVAASPASAGERRDECPGGTLYYTCNLGLGHRFDGCCSVNACVYGYCPDTMHPPTTGTETIEVPTPTATVEATSVGTPSVSPSSTPAAECTPGAKQFKQWEPRIYNIFPNSTEKTYKNITNTFIASQEDGRENKRDALLVFSQVNATDDADCSLGWYQPLQGTNFGYLNSGFMRVTGLELPEGKTFDEVVGDINDLSYEKVKKYIKTKVGAADITFWPQNASLQNHGVGSAPCNEDVVFHVTIDGTEDEAIAIMEVIADDASKGKIGWYITYDC